MQENWIRRVSRDRKEFEKETRTERLLLEHQKDRIQQLDVFGVVVDHVVKFQPPRPRLLAAQRFVETALPEDGQDLLQDEGQEERGAAAEEDVVGLGDVVELSRRMVTDKKLETEDDGEVGNEGCSDGDGGGDGSLAGDVVGVRVREFGEREGEEKICERGHRGSRVGCEEMEN